MKFVFFKSVESLFETPINDWNTLDVLDKRQQLPQQAAMRPTTSSTAQLTTQRSFIFLVNQQHLLPSHHHAFHSYIASRKVLQWTRSWTEILALEQNVFFHFCSFCKWRFPPH